MLDQPRMSSFISIFFLDHERSKRDSSRHIRAAQNLKQLERSKQSTDRGALSSFFRRSGRNLRARRLSHCAAVAWVWIRLAGTAWALLPRSNAWTALRRPSVACSHSPGAEVRSCVNHYRKINSTVNPERLQAALARSRLTLSCNSLTLSAEAR